MHSSVRDGEYASWTMYAYAIRLITLITPHQQTQQWAHSVRCLFVWQLRLTCCLMYMNTCCDLRAVSQPQLRRSRHIKCNCNRIYEHKPWRDITFHKLYPFSSAAPAEWRRNHKLFRCNHVSRLSVRDVLVWFPLPVRRCRRTKRNEMKRKEAEQRHVY